MIKVITVLGMLLLCFSANLFAQEESNNVKIMIKSVEFIRHPTGVYQHVASKLICDITIKIPVFDLSTTEPGSLPSLECSDSERGVRLISVNELTLSNYKPGYKTVISTLFIEENLNTRHNRAVLSISQPESIIAFSVEDQEDDPEVAGTKFIYNADVVVSPLLNDK